MRIVILGICGLVAAGVFLIMYLSIWRTRRHPGRAVTSRQHIVSEFVWLTIPVLILIAAAVPAVVAVMAGVPVH